ncbi:putative fatty acyl-CoA reductase CG5065 [Prorops nasuta]|uniref:putative fatty acyl-CoA reductase CG5065 n=1 Tax=Prorops nasuta TaxID=863751 RepID=UPI0034CD2845
MAETRDEQRVTIPEWFRKRNVLVTGGTGFMGKVLVSKLLLSCPDLGNVFLLVREKKGVNPQSRLKAIIQEEPFRSLRDNHSDRLKKLIIVPGDTTVKGVGLVPEDEQRLFNEVSVIFHMAANVRFDLPLKAAIKLNTGGTANILALAKQMKNLDSFVHVSTSFCHCGERILEERAYPVPVTPESVISTVEMMNDEVIEAMTPKLLGDSPNTYAFSKALSEDLVVRCGLPAGIARPSIVLASLKEPVPGWVENLNGPTGLMIGAGKGVIRSMLCNADYLVDVIPCDLAVNAIIAFAWRIALEKPVSPIFLNVTQNGENPLTWGEAIETGRRHAVTHPFSGPLWYPGGRVTSSKFLHTLAVFFLHLIPAYLLDGLMFLTGNKTFMIKVQNRVSSGLEMLQYYTTKPWIFQNDGMKDLQKRLSPDDKKTFFMDINSLVWNDYMLFYILGARKYCMKDDLSTLPRARRVFTYLYIADWCFFILFLALLGWLAYSFLTPFRSLTKTLIASNEI